MNDKIVIICNNEKLPSFIYNGLKKGYNIKNVIVESPLKKRVIIKNRIKKLGLFRVIGQILFRIIIFNFLNKKSQKRKFQIIKYYNLCDKKIDNNQIIRVQSVNSYACIKALLNINPKIVIVFGTRIISDKVLKKVKSTFINIHAGMTPMYRGVYGAYWALVNDDRENCGVTVHLIDKGIDTGDILYQKKINPSNDDNCATYIYLQIGVSMQLLTSSIDDILKNNATPTKNPMKGKLWSHPTIFEYFYFRFKRKII